MYVIEQNGCPELKYKPWFLEDEIYCPSKQWIAQLYFVWKFNNDDVLCMFILMCFMFVKKVIKNWFDRLTLARLRDEKKQIRHLASEDVLDYVLTSSSNT